MNSTTQGCFTVVQMQIITKTLSIAYKRFFLMRTPCCLSVISILPWCHLFWLVVLQSLSSGEAISDPSFSFKPCFRHAKLTATLWVNAACECWDARGVSEWKAPIPATCMVLYNWLRFVFFKGPLFLPLCLLLLV